MLMKQTLKQTTGGGEGGEEGRRGGGEEGRRGGGEEGRRGGRGEERGGRTLHSEVRAACVGG